MSVRVYWRTFQKGRRQWTKVHLIDPERQITRTTFCGVAVPARHKRGDQVPLGIPVCKMCGREAAQ